MTSRGELQGGACTGMCNDHYGVFFDVSSAWKEYTVSFAAITQHGWGKVVAKDLTQVISADFMYVGSYQGSRLTHDNPSSFDLLVDDAEVY